MSLMFEIPVTASFLLNFELFTYVNVIVLGPSDGTGRLHLGFKMIKETQGGL